MCEDDRKQALLRYCSDDNRICPQPLRWQEFWRLIGEPRSLSVPLILSGWNFSTDREKRERFESHLRYAIEDGMLDNAERFLMTLGVDDWHTCPSYLLDSSFGDHLVTEQEERAEAVQRAREIYAALRAIDKSDATRRSNLVNLLWKFECLYGPPLKQHETVKGIQQVLDRFNGMTGDPDFPFFEGEPTAVVQTLTKLKDSLQIILLIHGLLAASGTNDLDDLTEFVDDMLSIES